ncbi:hypothetical protein FHU23_002299 [Clostridium saccharobutylicum]|uniref:Uncharacterized protein n=2 Tax=Clostridium saccharobutylicum TaxID=169679 RepID=U5MLE1_CLOSA|nr:hypothetical protein CLSA_c02960 [Clostridium saccharobutylicum DSM 13864]MBA2905537.1 hypothetical protein [Clostridium saccharobutylicum]MBA8896936.1 hypothetical protein [Clostridium saccharobutylicum]MBA8982534.1 hypothetical protein [Clostridium saccharobutylicum]MBA9000793.1 hypothetical protein [Clostridium saccharobutylicum]
MDIPEIKVKVIEHRAEVKNVQNVKEEISVNFLME